MNKTFIKAPEDRFERIIFAANLTESLSGNKVTKKEIMESFDKENFMLSEEQQAEIDGRFQ